MFPLIDPDARHPFQLAEGWPGVVFQLRAIPHGKWQFIRSGLLLSYEKAKRRAVRDLLAEGANPEDRLNPEAETTLADVRAKIDPECALEIAALNLELLRWGLATVEGFEVGGVAFVVTEEETMFDGLPTKLLSRASARILSSQPGLLTILANEVWNLNEVGPAAKKA